MRYLLDTCVVSEFVKPKPERKVIAWLNAVDADQVYLSAVTIGEIQQGISLLPPSNRRTGLEAWLNAALPAQFADRILPLDGDTFAARGRLMADQKRRGAPMGVMDSLIAATALRHVMVLVTCNIDDFRTTGLSLLDPWI